MPEEQVQTVGNHDPFSKSRNYLLNDEVKNLKILLQLVTVQLTDHHQARWLA